MAYKLTAEALARLREELGELARRAARLKVTPISLRVVGEEIKEAEDGSAIVLHVVEVVGEAPKIAGAWVFAAALEPAEVPDALPEAQRAKLPRTLVKRMPLYEGELDIKWRDVEHDWCDHCRCARGRNKSYLVVNQETGEWKQLGGTCIRSYLGSWMDPQQLASYLEAVGSCLSGLSGLEEESDPDEIGWGCGGKKMFNVEHFLVHASAVVRRYGFVSKAQEEITGKPRTRDAVIWNIEEEARLKGKPGMDWRRQAVAWPDEKDREIAREALAWARGLLESDDWRQLSEYHVSLAQVAGSRYTTWNNLGLLASLIPAWRQARGEELDGTKPQVAGVHLGQPKQRLTFERLLCTYQREMNSKWGVTVLYLFTDPQGNTVKWFSSRAVCEQGRRYDIKATVKAHDEYRGSPVTVITNGVILKEHEPERTEQAYKLDGEVVEVAS